MAKSNANFHIHSTHSDGALTVNEIIEKMKELGVSYFSVTDHDCIKACSDMKEYRDLYAKSYYEYEDGRINQLRFNSINSDMDLKYRIDSSLHFIPGIELSCCFIDGEIGLDESWTCHILGYGFELDKMQAALNKISDDKNKLLHELFDLLVADGFNIDLKKIEQKGIISARKLISRELIRKGYAKNGDECYEKILNTDKYKKFAKAKPSIKEGIRILKDCGAVVVWAHPFGVSRGGKKELSQEQVITLFENMKEYGIDGIEAYYQKYDIDKINFLNDLADKNYLTKTVGTDYHAEGINNVLAFEKEGIDSGIFFKTVYTSDLMNALKESFYNKKLRELYNAIKRNDLAATDMLIKSGIDVNKYDDYRYKLFETACGFGYFEMVKLLVETEDGVNLEEFGSSGIHSAFGNHINYKPASYNSANRIKIIEYLLGKGVNAPNAYDHAVDENLLEFADLLLGSKEMSKKHKFIKYKKMLQDGNEYKEINDFIQKQDLPINEVINDDETLLTEAVTYNNAGVVKYLLNKGAKQGLTRDKEVKTASNISNDTAVLKLLLENGGDANATHKGETRNWNTALIDAVRIGNLEAVKLLLNYGADINGRNYYGDTPLIIAAIYNHVDIVKELLRQGADAMLENGDGNNALAISIGYTTSGPETFNAILNSKYITKTKEYLNIALNTAKKYYELATTDSNAKMAYQTAVYYKTLIDLTKTEIDLFELAFIYLHAQDIEKAEELFGQAAEKGNEDAYAYFLLLKNFKGISKEEPEVKYGTPAIFYCIKAIYDKDGNKIERIFDCTTANIAKIEAEKWNMTPETKQINLGEGEIITVNKNFFEPGYFNIISENDWFTENTEGKRYFNIHQTWYDFWQDKSGGVLVIDDSASFGLENNNNVQFYGDRENRHRLLRLLYQIELAERGNAKAAFIIGKRFYEGDGLKKSTEKAIYFLRSAAIKGSKEAFNLLKEIIMNKED